MLVIQSVSMINFQMNGDFAVHTGEVREARYEISTMPHIENCCANFFLTAQRLIFLPQRANVGRGREQTDLKTFDQTLAIFINLPYICIY